MGRRRAGKLCGLAATAAMFMTAEAAWAEPKVVVSIGPLHSLVSGVMEGVGEPALLVKGSASPHAYSLRPSEARALAESDVIFWIGEGLEQFLVKPLATLPESAHVIEISAVEGVELRPFREGATWDGHDHDHGHDDHGHDDHGHDDHDDHADDHSEDHKDHAHEDDDHEHDEKAEGHDHHAEHDEHGDFDPHLWLDPHNADHIVRVAVETLSKADPSNGDRYAANGRNMVDKLADLTSEIDGRLDPVKGKPYLVFHDAYQYFEARFGLTPAGSVTVNPEQAPGAKRLYEVRSKVVDLDAVCVFSEPQFEPALVETVIEGTLAKTAVLDPLGATLVPGPNAYFELLRGLAGSLGDCLSPQS